MNCLCGMGANKSPYTATSCIFMCTEIMYSFEWGVALLCIMFGVWPTRNIKTQGFMNELDLCACIIYMCVGGCGMEIQLTQELGEKKPSSISEREDEFPRQVDCRFKLNSNMNMIELVSQPSMPIPKSNRM